MWLNGLTENIFTQSDDWEELRRNVKDAVNGYYFDKEEKPQSATATFSS